MTTAIYSDKLGPRVPIMTNSPDQWIAENGMLLRVLVGSGVLHAGSR